MPQEKMEPIRLLALGPTDHVLGPAASAVTVIEYGDFACPYCRAAYPAVKMLLKHFQDRVRFAFRHFPVVEMHPHAERAAEAAESGGAQGAFWRMHDLLFENQQHQADDDLRQYAIQARLDLPMYDRDMVSRVHLRFVLEQMHHGKQLGARGTPTFFVNGVIEDVSYGMQGLYKAIEANLQPASVS